MAETRTGIAVAGSGCRGRHPVRDFAAPGALRLLCDTNATLLDASRP